MRLIICDPHLTFSESLAHVLTSRGTRVVAVVQKVSEVFIVLTRRPADLCVVGMGSDRSLTDERYATVGALCRRLPVVILADTATPALKAESAALSVRGLGEMGQGMADILRTFDRVHRGESVLDPVSAVPRWGAGEANDVHRMAAFLSARERAVLTALVRGDDTGTVARNLGISRTTTRGHVQGVLTKLGVHSRIAAVTLAVHADLVNPATGEWLAS